MSCWLASLFVQLAWSGSRRRPRVAPTRTRSFARFVNSASNADWKRGGLVTLSQTQLFPVSREQGGINKTILSITVYTSTLSASRCRQAQSCNYATHKLECNLAFYKLVPVFLGWTISVCIRVCMEAFIFTFTCTQCLPNLPCKAISYTWHLDKETIPTNV